MRRLLVPLVLLVTTPLWAPPAVAASCDYHLATGPTVGANTARFEAFRCLLVFPREVHEQRIQRVTLLESDATAPNGARERLAFEVESREIHYHDGRRTLWHEARLFAADVGSAAARHTEWESPGFEPTCAASGAVNATLVQATLTGVPLPRCIRGTEILA